MKKLIAVFLIICTSCYAGEPTPTPSPSPTETPTPPPPTFQLQRRWLIGASSDSTQQPGANPATTYFISTNYPRVKQLPDGSYMITFDQ